MNILQEGFLKNRCILITLILILIKLPLIGAYYPLSRYSYPTLCVSHFDNNIATTHTWLEADDPSIIETFRNYLQFIPRPYRADCYHCIGCNGLRLNLYDGFDWPSDDVDILEEIHKCHKKLSFKVFESCPSAKFGDDHCTSKCWNGAYFRKWNRKFIQFFRHFLTYCDQNQECSCYWPEMSLEALYINDKVYELLKELADNKLITPEYSEYWKAKAIRLDYHEGKVFDKEYGPNSHGIASSLATYTFFYSQYHQMLLSVASFIDSNDCFDSSWGIRLVYDMLEEIREDFAELYEECIDCHPHPKIYYELGMLKMHSGDSEGSLGYIRRLLDLANTAQYKNAGILTSEMYQQEGESYADIGRYDKAITSLTEAIKADPTNKEAYFHRSAAYFETGNFDQALQDYLISDRRKTITKPSNKISIDFHKALIKGTCQGACDAAVDFVPSLCHTAYGLGSTLWTSAQHPIETTHDFAEACHEMGECFVEFCKTAHVTTIEGCVDQLKMLYESFDKLSDSEKGELIGYTIGKYGVDIFAGSALCKGVAAYRNLKSANRICNLEAMAVSIAKKEKITAAALKQYSERRKFFDGSRIHWDKQNKHIPGKHNFLKGGSVFEHKEADRLLKQYAGTGSIGNGTPGASGYKEIVDFKEHIGIWRNEVGLSLPTTKGKIHYKKNGEAHIVPSHPETKIWE